MAAAKRVPGDVRAHELCLPPGAACRWCRVCLPVLLPYACRCCCLMLMLMAVDRGRVQVMPAWARQKLAARAAAAGSAGSTAAEPAALHLDHWIVHIDGDYLGFDRQAEFAVGADACYVLMPAAVKYGHACLFPVVGVRARYRLLVRAPSPGVVPAFSSELNAKRQLTAPVPLLVLSAEGARACMGVLTKAVRRGVRVRVRADWCEDGSSETQKYAGLLGVEGVLSAAVAAGLWTVAWPSGVVKQETFDEPLPIGGARGQGRAVSLVLSLCARDADGRWMRSFTPLVPLDAFLDSAAKENAFVDQVLASPTLLTPLCPR